MTTHPTTRPAEVQAAIDGLHAAAKIKDAQGVYPPDVKDLFGLDSRTDDYILKCFEVIYHFGDAILAQLESGNAAALRAALEVFAAPDMWLEHSDGLLEWRGAGEWANPMQQAQAALAATSAQDAGWLPISEFPKDAEFGSSWEIVGINVNGMPERHLICRWLDGELFGLPGHVGIRASHFRKPRDLPPAPAVHDGER